MNNCDNLILIPARFASTRFPGKSLAKILGKSMLQRVYENVTTSGFDVAAVTDNSEIEEHVKSFGGVALKVEDDVASGTERIALAYERFCLNKNYKLIINVQGDEPLLGGDEISRLAQFHAGSSYDICTLVKEQVGLEDEFKDSNNVKVIFNEVNGDCHYFSRAPIPFHRKDAGELLNVKKWFMHIGVYSYTPNALLKFSKMPVAYYESLEKLEQLRAIELGLKIGGITTNQNLLGVDLPEDIKKIEGVLGGKDS